VFAWDRGEHTRAFGLFERRSRPMRRTPSQSQQPRDGAAQSVTPAPRRRRLRAAERHLRAFSRSAATRSPTKTSHSCTRSGRTQDSSYLLLADLVITQAQRILRLGGAAASAQCAASCSGR
jgi:hypothetical protein